MNTCPNCQFLVTEGATTCSVCHHDLTAAPTPVAASGFAAPGTPAAPGATGAPGSFTPGGFDQPQAFPPPPAWGSAAPGTGSPPPPAKKKSSATKVLLMLGAIVVVVGGLAVLAFGAVSFLADPTEIASEDLAWEEYRAPDGRFRLEMPGEVEESTVEVPNGIGGKSEMLAINVFGADFVATVTTYEGAIEAGLTFADLPFSPDSALRGAAANGFKDGEMVEHTILAEHANNQMQVEISGRVDGEQAVMISRLVIAGTELYEVSIAGVSEERANLLEAHDRMAASFVAPAG